VSHTTRLSNLTLTRPTTKFIKSKPTRELRGELDDIGDCFGEFTGNLRAALDNAGYTIAVATGKADSNNCAFPFAESLKHLISGMGKCKDLPKEIQSLFCGFQPYLGGDDLLWAINKACNTDKHRTCAPMFNIFARNDVSVGGTRFFQMPLKHTWDSAKNEMILFTLGPGPEKKFDYNFQFTVFIACDKIKTIEGEPILGIADRMGRKVESILMAIEAESRRLGFTM
jgi:hypothetical protein